MRFLLVIWCCALALAAATLPPRLVAAQNKKPAATTKPDTTKLADLATRLEKLEEEPVNVELKSGTTLARCKLLSITRDGADGPPKLLQLKDNDTGRTMSINFSSIRSLSIEREKVYQASSTGAPRTAAEAKAEREAKQAAEERERWTARAKKNGVKVIPELTNEQHEAAVDELQKMVKDIQKVFSDMELYETHEFMFLSNMPRDQVIPYASSLDKMHDMMCSMYGIKKGTPVWRGKCLVVAFIHPVQFRQFESQFFQFNATPGIYGLCHSNNAGKVVISCYRGDDPNNFGQMLVHETSHGFIARYRTLAPMPSWVNEGMAEWIGRALVPDSTAVKRKEAHSLELMTQTRGMQGMFTARPIEAEHYGMAYSLTNFLIATDKKKYAEFVNGIKEGKKWEQSLADAYRVTPEQLLANYGRAIGVPDLRP